MSDNTPAFSKEMDETIMNLGACGWSDFERISIVIDKPVAWVEDQYNDADSDFMRLYKKGEVMAQYTLDLKNFTLARTGDPAATKRFDARRKKEVRNRHDM